MSKKIIFLCSVVITFAILACGTGDFFLPGNNKSIIEISPTTILAQTHELKTITETLIPSTLTPTPLPSLTSSSTPQPSIPVIRSASTTPDPSPTFASLILRRYGPEYFPDDINPLTGLEAREPLNLNRRPIAAKISNYPHNVRPQSGLSMADHVFEYYLENEITRFIAIFYSNEASKFGPIRSGRIFDEHIMRMYNAVFVFNSADKKVLDYYEELELNQNLFVVDRFCPPLCRDNSITSYNNLFGDTIEIHKYLNGIGVDNSRQDLSGNFFYSFGKKSNFAGSRVYIDYSYANYAYWEFEADNQNYLRYQGSSDNLSDGAQYTLLTDSLTDEPVAFDNIVVLFVPHTFFFKSSDTEIFDIKLTGSGLAFIFSKGKGYQAIWERTDINKPLSLQDTDKQPFPLKPGTIFFQVLSHNSTFGRTDDIWKFQFVRPEE